MLHDTVEAMEGDAGAELSKRAPCDEVEKLRLRGEGGFVSTPCLACTALLHSQTILRTALYCSPCQYQTAECPRAGAMNRHRAHVPGWVGGLKNSKL